jgi:hypothetical protein
MPGLKTAAAVIASNSAIGVDGERQVPAHCRTPATGLIRQSAPNSHSSVSQIALSIRGAASASVGDSARAKAVSDTRIHCRDGICMPEGRSSNGFTPALP